jgi:hypothetical protein
LGVEGARSADVALPDEALAEAGAGAGFSGEVTQAADSNAATAQTVMQTIGRYVYIGIPSTNVLKIRPLYFFCCGTQI